MAKDHHLPSVEHYKKLQVLPEPAKHHLFLTIYRIECIVHLYSYNIIAVFGIAKKGKKNGPGLVLSVHVLQFNLKKLESKRNIVLCLGGTEI